jgi:hypothetical protein
MKRVSCPWRVILETEGLFVHIADLRRKQPVPLTCCLCSAFVSLLEFDVIAYWSSPSPTDACLLETRRLSTRRSSSNLGFVPPPDTSLIQAVTDERDDANSKKYADLRLFSRIFIMGGAANMPGLRHSLVPRCSLPCRAKAIHTSRLCGPGLERGEIISWPTVAGTEPKL